MLLLTHSTSFQRQSLFLMFKRLLQAAFESGQDILVVIRGQEDPAQGRVQDFDGEYFTILSTGCCAPDCPGDCQGMLWAFHLADVQSIGLPVNKPKDETFANFNATLIESPENCSILEELSSPAVEDSSCHQKGNAID